LLIATDSVSTWFSEGGPEPVMYLSEDTFALLWAAPRLKVSRVLDACCGCGVQGIAALRYYAEEAMFVDLNPRAIQFTQFNLALNGLTHKVSGLHVGDVCSALPGLQVGFDAVVANPPFIPNPRGIARVAGELFGDGGDTGEHILAGIIRDAHRLVAPGGWLTTPAKTPNIEGLPNRFERWYAATAGRAEAFEALVFRGHPKQATLHALTTTTFEAERYQKALRGMGIKTLSQTVVVLFPGGALPPGQRVRLCDGPRPDLWDDEAFLRDVVASATPSFAGCVHPSALGVPSAAAAGRAVAG